MNNHKQAFSGAARMLLIGLQRAVRYLPLAYAVNVIRLHNSVGYERYLEKTVGTDVLSRSGDGALDLMGWGSDLQVWTDARLSYWSDTLAVSLSWDALSMGVVPLALMFGLVSSCLSIVVGDLLRAGASDGAAARQSVVRESAYPDGPSI